MDCVGGVDNYIQKLNRLLLMISVVLDEAERRLTSDGALCNWLRNLEDAAFDLDDLVGECQTKAKRCVSSSSSIRNLIVGVFTYLSFKPL